MYVMIDNFDSFVYNLKAYFQELGREILVRRCDEITLEELEELNPEGIILSPGTEASLGCEALRRYRKKISGKDSCSWCLSGPSGAWPLCGSSSGKGSVSHARKSNRDPQPRNRSVCRPA